MNSESAVGWESQHSIWVAEPALGWQSQHSIWVAVAALGRSTSAKPYSQYVRHAVANKTILELEMFLSNVTCTIAKKTAPASTFIMISYIRISVKRIFVSKELYRYIQNGLPGCGECMTGRSRQQPRHLHSSSMCLYMLVVGNFTEGADGGDRVDTLRAGHRLQHEPACNSRLTFNKHLTNRLPPEIIMRK